MGHRRTMALAQLLLAIVVYFASAEDEPTTRGAEPEPTTRGALETLRTTEGDDSVEAKRSVDDEHIEHVAEIIKQAAEEKQQLEEEQANSVDPEKVEKVKKLAEDGDANAQHTLGVLYRNGRGVEQNDDLSAQWLLKAAEQGRPEAQSDYGYMCAFGRGVEKSDEQAAVWFRMAADQGNMLAQVNLAEMYKHGKVASSVRDGNTDGDSVLLYQKAAEQGDPDAHFFMGEMHRMGRGVDKDVEKAKEWYKKAAEKGHTVAQKKLHEEL